MRLKPIMFVGTGSDVGKSIINTGFCRIFLQDGYSPAPFKGQNMSLNSYATPDGLEIGRAQAVQAEACGIACHADMNPILLKPNNYTQSQVIINGKVAGNQTAKAYFAENKLKQLFPIVTEAFDRLNEIYSPIVMEGAGSISEINLKDRDVTNMRIALHAGAAVYLVADIDRGGIFGSVYGTILLLSPEERALVKGIIVNKFRGDISLFAEGASKIEELTGIPVVGIVPYFHEIFIDDEDSVVLDHKNKIKQEGKVNVAVVLLRKMSNFTDFNMLERDERCNLYYAANPEDIENADIVILPGSKNTISDLIDLQKRGMVKAIKDAYNKNKTVIGICGGFQMLGKTIFDPNGVEGDIEVFPGLGILPVDTTLLKEKTTVQCQFHFMNKDELCKGYEIHMGETKANEPSPLIIKTDGFSDGYLLNNKCWGTYIHGILDNPTVIDHLLSDYTEEKNNLTNLESFKNQQYNLLADHIRKHVDMKRIYQDLIIR